MEKADNFNYSFTKCLHTKLQNGTFIVFDIETTGGNPEKNGITEIFALRYSKGKIADTFYSLINPQFPIPPIVRRMTGITNQMVRSAPTIHEVMPKFLNFIGNECLVSHNTIGDLKFLRFYAQKVCQIQLNHFYLCTHLLTEKLLPQAPDKSLGGLAKYLGIKTDNLHRAEADTFLTLELFKSLVEKLHQKGNVHIVDAIRLQGDLESGMRLGWAIEDEKLKALPQSCGIIQLLDKHNQPIFIASCQNIKKEAYRLKQFHELPRQLLRLVVQAHHIHFEVQSHLVAAMLREAELISLYGQLKFSPHQWHHRAIAAITLNRESEEMRACIAHITPTTTEAFGPVKDRRKSQKDLDQAAKALAFKSSRKGIIFPPSKLNILCAYLSGTLSREVASLNKSKFSLFYLLINRARNQIKENLKDANILSDLPLQCEYTSLLNENGVICAPLNAKGDKWHLYPVTNSQAGQPIVVDENWQDWLLSHKGAKFYQSLRRLAQKKQLIKLNQANFACISATLWLISVANQRRGSFHEFWSITDLDKMR